MYIYLIGITSWKQLKEGLKDNLVKKNFFHFSVEFLNSLLVKFLKILFEKLRVC